MPLIDSTTEAMPPDGPPSIPPDHRAAVPVPQPPYGWWSEAGRELLAIGRTNSWSTMLRPGAEGADTRVSVGFTVERSCQAPRQLPGGCVRWGFHWGENLPGWDVGLVFGYQDPLNYYRLQLSTANGELALWDATGGLLQLIPCKLALGESHELVLTQHGAHIQAQIDGKAVMDYWDRSHPYTAGQVGLSVWKSRVRFDRFAVERLPVDSAPLPPHVPDFRVEVSDNVLGGGHPAFHQDPQTALVLFDGYEPISAFWKGSNLIQEAVKLKPGWRAPYYTPIGPTMSGTWPPLVGEIPDALQVTGGGQEITLTFATEEPEVAHTDYNLVVKWDAERGVYRYEYQGTLEVLGPKLLNEYELYDPLTYNNRIPGPEVIHTWNPVGHRWHVYQGPGGKWMRYPIVDYLTDYNNNEVNWPKFKDFLYPDPIAPPAFETEMGWDRPEGRRFFLGLCTWGYDFHHSEKGRNYTMDTGTERPFAFTFTALTPEEAQQLYDESVLPDKIAADTTKLIPFNPRGTDFQTTATWQNPSPTPLWAGRGAGLDTTVGHGDQASFRIDGPGTAEVFLYQYIFEQYAEKWWVRGWFRTKGVRGQGLKLQVSYAYDKEAQDDFYLGGRGDQDWTYFSFLTTAPRLRDASRLVFSLDGGGQTWLDDVAFSAVTETQPPRVTTFAMPDSVKPRSDLLIDLALTEKPDPAAFDMSYNGHSLVLTGTNWLQEAGRSFLRFDGLKDSASIPFTSVLEPIPGPPGDTAYRPVFPLQQFSYEFWVRPRPPATPGAGKMMIFHSRFNPQVYFDQLSAKPGECRFVYQNNVYQGAPVVLQATVPYDQWLHMVATHGQGKVVLYLNGVRAGETAYDPQAPGFDFSGGEWGLWVGAWRYGGQNLTGDLGPFRLYTKALSPTEVAEHYRP